MLKITLLEKCQAMVRMTAVQINTEVQMKGWKLKSQTD